MNRFDQHQKEFVKLTHQLDRHSNNALSDFAELVAISIHNSILKDEQSEERYLQTIKKYTKEEAAIFPKMLSCITLSLEDRPRDVLGELYMSDELRARSKWDSDVEFTPFEVAKMMAMMTFDDKPPERGFWRVAEPAAGTGCMVIAASEVLRERGLNPQKVMHTTAVELRSTVAHLCYVQLSLLGLPAIVIHGDSLALTTYSTWRTPMHYLGFWEGRSRQTSNIECVAVAAAQPKPQKGQMSLF